jgi:hypothetical protein
MPEATNIRSRLLIAALIFSLAFFVHETIVRTYDLYRNAPWVDIPGHVLAGMAAGALFYWILHGLGAASAHRRAVITTFVLALLWEGVEMLQEVLWPDPLWLRDVFWWDGFFDVFFTTLGALGVFPLLRWMRARFRAFRPMDV